MNLTGVEVSCDALFKLQPNTVLVVISDKDGSTRLVQVDHDSIPQKRILFESSHCENCNERQDANWLLCAH
jgi:hypothetical protein